MHWEKRGLLLPAPPPLSWAASHAALPVPQPLADGHVRLYFSARDAEGRSQIACAELETLEAGAPARFRPEPVVGLGPKGAFDDNGVTSSCLVEHDRRQLLYYTGWTLGVTVPFRFFVGCAVSEDGGATFRKVSPAPVLGPTAVDPFLTASPWVLVEEGRWHMWYVSGTGWDVVEGEPRPRYHVKYAESDDGSSWDRDGRVCIDFAAADEYAIGRPCVVRDGDLYRMWFCSRGGAYRIGYAESADGLSWERSEAGIDVSAEGWDSEMQAYPVVFDHAGGRHMLYNGNGYGATGIGHAVLVG